MDVRILKNFSFAFLFFGCLFFSQISHAQLPAFNLQVTAVNETCTANASLSFNATNTQSGAIILYRVYKLPDITTPIAVTNTNNFGGLTAGDYRVVAIQSLGAQSNTQQQDIHITNQIVPVVFQVTGVPAAFCSTSATLTVNVTQGTPAMYEIISGPILVTPQPSNVFTGLIPGDYVVRVIDACGDGVVQTYHFPVPPPNLTTHLDQNCDLVNCNTKSVSVAVQPLSGTNIVYPLTVQFTVYPPSGTPIVYTQTLTSGSTSSLQVPFSFPFTSTSGYVGGIRIVDPCGNILALNNIALDLAPKLGFITDDTMCHPEQLALSVCNMIPPYMVEFLSAPAGFVPANYNPGNLGPFTSTPIIYGQDIPDGHYGVRITDSCGRTAEASTDFVKAITDHILKVDYIGCPPIFIIRIPDQGIKVVSVIMTSAPPGYPHALPWDVSFNISNGIFTMNLPLAGTYTFTGINVCGRPFTRTVTVIPPTPILSASGSAVTACNALGTIGVSLQGPPIAAVVIVAAPLALTHPLPYDVSAFINAPPTTATILGLPVGTYTLLVTDVCGTVYPVVVATVGVAPSLDPPVVTFLRGCAHGDGSIRMQSAHSKWQQIIITSAPAGFNHALPYDVSFNLDPLGVFYMNTLAEGTYIFHTKDICNVESDATVNVPGYDIIQNDVTLQGNCGSFNLFVSHRVGEPVVHGLWLQKFYPATGLWGHPLTGVPYTPGNVPTPLDSYWLVNNTTNYNIAALGTFRVLKYNIYYSNGIAAFSNCFESIKEFEFLGDLKIDSASAVPCGNNTNDVFITATGIPPFTYKITTKDGLPFLVDNGDSNIFHGLVPGIYNFQVQDLCGNIVNRLFDITTLAEPAITAANLCIGENGQLSVPAISFLSYQWWNGNAPTVILSTTNTLNLSPFSNATSPGTYFVRIYSTSNLSCINKTISYVVPAVLPPNAGLDGVRTICNDNPIDLFTVLGAPYDAGGNWEETTNSGALAGNTWSPSGVAYGTYNFVYKIDGLCTLTDQAGVTIHYNPAPPAPVVTADTDFCINQAIQLHVDSIQNAAYQWTGPNGFTSNQQNPTIASGAAANSGSYSVVATVNGCSSEANIELNVLPTPDYHITPSCVNNVYTVTVVPNNNSFNPADASYSWTGPSGFSSSENPIQITGLPSGLYQVIVTNPEGCQETHSIPVSRTSCSTVIPTVITPNDDQSNDNFDLAGFDVDKIEIYNRWGRLVYEQNNYIDQWHGQNMHNTELPDSTYYYILYFRTGGEKQGWVYKFSWK